MGRQREVFIAGCNTQEMDENGKFPCRPRFIDADGKSWVSERPVIIKIQGKEAQIFDDGDCPDFVLEKLKNHIQKNAL